MGRPPGSRDFQRHHARKPIRCLRTNDRDGIADIREKSIEPDEDRPIKSAWPDPFRQAAAQNIDLMAENNDFRFKSSAQHKTIA
jgi:hypothetical protein